MTDGVLLNCYGKHQLFSYADGKGICLYFRDHPVVLSQKAFHGLQVLLLENPVYDIPLELVLKKWLFEGTELRALLLSASNHELENLQVLVGQVSVLAQAYAVPGVLPAVE